jgi:hypothetical protein
MFSEKRQFFHWTPGIGSLLSFDNFLAGVSHPSARISRPDAPVRLHETLSIRPGLIFGDTPAGHR